MEYVDLVAIGKETESIRAKNLHKRTRTLQIGLWKGKKSNWEKGNEQNKREMK